MYWKPSVRSISSSPMIPISNCKLLMSLSIFGRCTTSSNLLTSLLCGRKTKVSPRNLALSVPHCLQILRTHLISCTPRWLKIFSQISLGTSGKASRLGSEQSKFIARNDSQLCTYRGCFAQWRRKDSLIDCTCCWLPSLLLSSASEMSRSSREMIFSAACSHQLCSIAWVAGKDAYRWKPPTSRHSQFHVSPPLYEEEMSIVAAGIL